MRKFFIIFLQLFFLVSVTVGGFTACSTNDTEDGFEAELNNELDDMNGNSLDDAEVSDADTEDKSAVAEGDIKSDNEDDFSDENFDADTKAKTADAGGSSDSEFAAEDADKPTNAASSTDDLAEQDLANELGKGGGKDTAAKDGGDMAATAAPAPAAPSGNDQIVPYPDEPTATAANLPPGLKTDPNEPIVPSGDVTPVAPSSAGVATGTITSKEAIPNADPFEQVTTGPTVPTEDIGVSDPLVAEVDPPLPAQKAAQEIVPVSRVEKDPFFKNERLMNTYYIARPGEDLGTISQKIYNEDKTAILREDNPHVTKVLEPGDKIYYNSPNRPDDKKAILSYYEDNRMAPLTYTTKKGDDIQKIGRQVLGFEDGWKEIWATNDALQTQALLPAGLKLRYWTGNEMKMASAAPVPAATEPPPQAVAKEPVPETPIDLPPAEPAALPQEDPGLRMNDPAPLPSDTLVTTPAIDNADKDSNLLTVAGGAIAVLAIVALIGIQIKNRKREANSGGMPPSLDFNKV